MLKKIDQTFQERIFQLPNSRNISSKPLCLCVCVLPWRGDVSLWGPWKQYYQGLTTGGMEISLNFAVCVIFNLDNKNMSHFLGLIHHDNTNVWLPNNTAEFLNTHQVKWTGFSKAFSKMLFCYSGFTHPFLGFVWFVFSLIQFSQA